MPGGGSPATAAATRLSTPSSTWSPSTTTRRAREVAWALRRAHVGRLFGGGAAEALAARGDFEGARRAEVLPEAGVRPSGLPIAFGRRAA